MPVRVAAIASPSSKGSQPVMGRSVEWPIHSMVQMLKGVELAHEIRGIEYMCYYMRETDADLRYGTYYEVLNVYAFYSKRGV